MTRLIVFEDEASGFSEYEMHVFYFVLWTALGGLVGGAVGLLIERAVCRRITEREHLSFFDSAIELPDESQERAQGQVAEQHMDI